MFGFFKSHPISSIAPRQAFDRAQSAEIVLVDVRETGEWAQMRLLGAVHLPLSDFAARAGTLPKDRPVVFYCLSGKRSKSAIAICRKLGLPHDTDIAGGIMAWRAEGLPIAS